jgi:hypothetical protein
MVELYLHSPIRLNGMVLNYLSTGAPIPYLPIYFNTSKLSDRT